MNKLTLLVIALFAIFAIATTAVGQQGTAMLKIVKSADGSIKVYSVEGNEITQSTATQQEITTSDEAKVKTETEEQQIHQVIPDETAAETIEISKSSDLQQNIESKYIRV